MKLHQNQVANSHSVLVQSETQQKASQGEIAVADAVVVVVAAAAAVAAAVEAWLAALYFAVSGVAEIEFAAAAAPSHTFWQTHSLCFYTKSPPRTLRRPQWM
jgi:hypothetical protein